MIEHFYEQIADLIDELGITLLDCTSSPKNPDYKNEYIAFVTIKEVRRLQTGMVFYTDGPSSYHKYTFECRLLGKQGDCSDRSALIEKADALRAALDADGFSATLCHNDRIDPVLSRAECLLKITMDLFTSPSGGN